MKPTATVVVCAFNIYLSSTAIMLNIVTILAIRKKTLLLSLAVSDLGVGLTAESFYAAFHVMQLKQADNSRTYYATSHRINGLDKHFWLCFMFSCGGFNYRQILGYSPLSQIQGACDLQARCSCGNLHMAFSAILSLILFWIPVIHLVWNCFLCLYMNCNTLELQDLFLSTRPNNPNSRNGTHCTTSSTEW